MYTQCPNCRAIFDLTDEGPDTSQGPVRCGRCREVFNAPWNLVASLPGDDQPGIVMSSDESVGDDPRGGYKEAAGSDPKSTPPTASGIPRKRDSDTMQQWTVSELGPGHGGLTERTDPDLQVPAKIDEEIVIEAPLNLWDVGDEREDLESEPAAPVDDGAGPPGLKKLEPRMISIARHADDVKLVHIPDPKPIQSAAWVVVALILVAAVFWQLKQYYISDLAGIVSLRGPLETVCEYASCTVPPRTDIKRIDLVSTSVDPHPATPGALRVGAILINRATFVQPFPPLEVTLTDREGAVVGRRTYLPHEYSAGPPGDMSPNVLQRADLDLAQPAESAVGYEIQLVSR